MTRKLLSLLMALAMMLAVAGVASAADTPLTVTDMMGREVEISSLPETVVSLTPAGTEILFALGVGDKVVGVDASSNYPPEVANIENIVGDYSGVNVELIVSLEPDVVFASNKLQADIIAQLEELDLTVVSLEATTYDDIYVSIELAAEVMSVDPTALIDDMKAREQVVLDAAAQFESAPAVYFALSYGEYGDWSAGPGTFINSMIEMAGGVNIASDSPVEWPMYSLEQIVSGDPDIILVSDYSGTAADEFASAEVYSELRAVTEENVYSINADASSRPGPRIIDALEEISSALADAAALDDAA